MYRSVTTLLGLARSRGAVEGSVAETASGLAVVTHGATRRRTSEGTHLAVTVRVRNEDTVTRSPVPVRVQFYQARWLGLRAEPLAPVERATDRLAPGETTTVEVSWHDAETVARYTVAVG